MPALPCPAPVNDGPARPAADWHAELLAQSQGPSQSWRRDLPFSVLAFERTPPQVLQPSLSDDVVCLHRGGAKRVHRQRDGRCTVHDVPADGITVMPRYYTATWRTEGPIDYVHLTLQRPALNTLLGAAWEGIELRDEVGFTHPLLSALAGELVRLAWSGPGLEDRLYIDSILTSFALTLTRRQAERGAAPEPPPAWNATGGMAPWRLRRVTDFMQAHSHREIGLDELMSVADVSRAHLFRAFRHSTGTTPGRYLQQLRVEKARQAIGAGADVNQAATTAGFASLAAMSRAFRRVLNVTPEGYRRWLRP